VVLEYREGNDVSYASAIGQKHDQSIDPKSLYKSKTRDQEYLTQSEKLAAFELLRNDWAFCVPAILGPIMLSQMLHRQFGPH
jgi:hypothetical protein